jgi:hypothetical protein
MKNQPSLKTFRWWLSDYLTLTNEELKRQIASGHDPDKITRLTVEVETLRRVQQVNEQLKGVQE